jgi:hypothetical protein
MASDSDYEKVRQSPYALCNVIDQTDDLCMYAVSLDGSAL